jgi:hypothetical protein
MFSGWVWPEMKKVSGNGGSRLGQPSPVSAVAGEVRENWRIRRKKKKIWVFCSHFIFLEMVRCQHVNGGQKTPPFCLIRIAAAL